MIALVQSQKRPHKWVDEIWTRKRRHVAAACNLLVRPHGAGPAQNRRDFADGQYRVWIAYEKSRTGQQACPLFHGCGFVRHCNSSVSALRFFFTVTLRPDLARRLTVVPQP